MVLVLIGWMLQYERRSNKRFEARLDNEYLELFKKNELFKEGNILDWENLNGTDQITVLSYDGIKVSFKNNASGKVETFTLNNLFIYNKAHLESLLKTEVYDSEKHTLEDYLHIDYDCIYIIHDKNCDESTGYYVGQAKHGSWRIKDHFHNSSVGKIDKLIHEGMRYSLRFIPLEGSGYSSLNALETAFIAYYNSFHTGYNKTRGNNGPGNSRITMKLLKG